MGLCTFYVNSGGGCTGYFHLDYMVITHGWVDENSVITVIMTHRVSQDGSTVHGPRT